MAQAESIQVADLATQIASALALAVERSDRLQKVLGSDDAVVIFNPIIRFGGLIAVARGGLGNVIQQQLEG